ncbi:DUF3597 domain-containing protein [Zophobihabitans entericus]|uniref:DUF3597 domain-containing protein n=1 Tax=Zophobihabitans entericus TaxID=1635327 RepID=A0A6G9I9F9_9GAMM|nr:DUF3597 domain-containing protein [Zophobihabitans entericus]QIQ20364.1 DUF3597 domain-containing protein [Zophobihabitans entericus]
MSIFKDIMSKIFTPAFGSMKDIADKVNKGNQTEEAVAPAPAEQAPQAEQPATVVDVESILDGMLKQSGQKLNWRVSIVDLMKLLGLDSSLPARKQLAAELHYQGDTNDSASMNIWLHKQVMRKLAENGGKVPDSLK